MKTLYLVIKMYVLVKGYFYILSNSTRTLLYVGATKYISDRLEAHKNGSGAKFTKKYHVKYLMYFEAFEDSKLAFKREKQVKNWKKEWKWNLIKGTNPNLIDLRDEVL
jgi:putative endonuclease